MGLRDFPGVIEALNADKTFAINVFLDRLVSGSFFTGVNNWVWVELPRAFLMNKALLEVGRREEAKVGFDRLLEIPQVRENGEVYWLLLNDRGRIAEAEGALGEALQYYRQAIDVLEEQRSGINTEASKIGFVGNKQEIYFRTVDLAHRLQLPEVAYSYMERSKSRSLVDLLASRVSILRNAATPVDQSLFDDFALSREKAAAQVPLDMSSQGASISATRQVAAAKKVELRTKAPDLASLVTVNALTLNEAVSYLKPGEVLLEYFGNANKVYGFASDGKQHLLVNIESTQLEQQIRQLRTQISKLEPYEDIARDLHRILIKPFASILKTQDLLLIPHGPLHYLPFAALMEGDAPLIAQRGLRILPSASVHKYLKPALRDKGLNLLVFGNPDLGNRNLDLPSAEEEAKLVAGLVPGSRIFLRKDASETALKHSASSAQYLHIASHGQFKADSALDSRLLLAPDESNDGSLTVTELYGMRIDAELVILSACETGLGKVLSGDDLVGLTRGFLYAGSRNIVASLWEVDDQATSEMMSHFYTLLKAGHGKRQALRQAQMTLRAKYPEPMFWSAFYLVGEGV